MADTLCPSKMSRCSSVAESKHRALKIAPAPPCPRVGADASSPGCRWGRPPAASLSRPVLSRGGAEASPPWGAHPAPSGAPWGEGAAAEGQGHRCRVCGARPRASESAGGRHGDTGDAHLVSALPREGDALSRSRAPGSALACRVWARRLPLRPGEPAGSAPGTFLRHRDCGKAGGTTWGQPRRDPARCRWKAGGAQGSRGSRGGRPVLGGSCAHCCEACDRGVPGGRDPSPGPSRAARGPPPAAARGAEGPGDGQCRWSHHRPSPGCADQRRCWSRREGASHEGNWISA